MLLLPVFWAAYSNQYSGNFQTYYFGVRARALIGFVSNFGTLLSSQLISMAMAEASKLFDKSGGASSGGKQDAVNSAAMTVMKLLVQSKFSSTTGGSNSGGLSSLLSMVST